MSILGDSLFNSRKPQMKEKKRKMRVPVHESRYAEMPRNGLRARVATSGRGLREKGQTKTTTGELQVDNASRGSKRRENATALNEVHNLNLFDELSQSVGGRSLR
ncbi:hypothetical protein MRX96_038735 [Rhipicephalus microplus]